MGIIEDICVSISGIACRLYNGSKQDDTPMGPKIKKYGTSSIWQMYLQFSLRNEDDNSPSNFYLLFVTSHWVGCPITFHSKIFPMEQNTDVIIFEAWHNIAKYEDETNFFGGVDDHEFSFWDPPPDLAGQNLD